MSASNELQSDGSSLSKALPLLPSVENGQILVKSGLVGTTAPENTPPSSTPSQLSLSINSTISQQSSKRLIDSLRDDYEGFISSEQFLDTFAATDLEASRWVEDDLIKMQAEHEAKLLELLEKLKITQEVAQQREAYLQAREAEARQREEEVRAELLALRSAVSREADHLMKQKQNLTQMEADALQRAKETVKTTTSHIPPTQPLPPPPSHKHGTKKSQSPQPSEPLQQPQKTTSPVSFPLRSSAPPKPDQLGHVTTIGRFPPGFEPHTLLTDATQHDIELLRLLVLPKNDHIQSASDTPSRIPLRQPQASPPVRTPQSHSTPRQPFDTHSHYAPQSSHNPREPQSNMDRTGMDVERARVEHFSPPQVGRVSW